jgi:hypothetical protein
MASLNNTLKTYFGNSEQMCILHLRPRESSAKDNMTVNKTVISHEFPRTKSCTPVLITTLTLLLQYNIPYETPITKAGNLITVLQLQVFTGMFFVTCFLVNESYYIL